MDRFLIKWYFYYNKGGAFYMVPQKFKKKKISPGAQNLCQNYNIQYIKLKENGNLKMGNLALTEILSTWR